MKKIFKQIIFSLIGIFLVLVLGSQARAATGWDYTAWSDQGVVYEAPAGGNAYYPSVVYDANGFGTGTPGYSMWYSDGNGSAFLVTSTDGISWGAPTVMAGLVNIHHVQVLYDANCFGTIPCSVTTTKYRIWFQDIGAPTIYSISSLATAESADGINWINQQAITQNASAQLVIDPYVGAGWNSGTYGPVNVFYQPNAANTGTEPWDYRYVMYYDGTDGNHEYTGLAYSADGLYWNAYTGNPVLSGSLVGGNEAWDCISAVYGTVFKDSLGYHFFYSGSGKDDGLGGCTNSDSFTGIGYASSADGKTWVKNTNPIFQINDGVPYRSGRIYTPSVVNDGSGILRIYFSVKDSVGGPKKIGYATLLSPTSALPFFVTENPAPVFPTLVPDQAYVIKDNINYKLYYAGNDFASINLAQSPDGITWTPYAGNPIITDAQYHADVKYYDVGFPGANSGTNPSALTMNYRMWYQGLDGHSISGWRYAESPDGISWYNRIPVAQFGAAIFDGANAGVHYGIADVVYTAGASNTGTDWTFRIYANVQWEDAPYIGKELVVMAFSADGYNWTGYDPTSVGYATPVFSGTLHSGDFDSDHIGWFKVIKNSETDWRAFYSGGKDTTFQALNGIGYATSTDGINWVRRQTLFTTNDSTSWRNQSVWMPSVTKTDTNTYKIWFLGSDNSDIGASDWIQWKLGMADLTTTLTPPPSGGGGSSRRHEGTITVVNTVINDNGGTKKVTDFPLFVNGTPVVSGVANYFPAPSDVYKITETADPNYTQTFSGDCSNEGYISLNPDDNAFCVITNDDIDLHMSAPKETPIIDVMKSAYPLSLPAGPGPVTFTYTLANLGTLPVTDITIIDDSCAPIKLISGDTNADSKLDVNETWTYQCSAKLSETHTDAVVASGWANGVSATDIASATVVVGSANVSPLIHVIYAIHVTKIANPLTLMSGGGIVTYTEKVTNPGTVPLSNVSLTDKKCSPIKYVSGDTNHDSQLDTTETWTYTCTTRLTETTANTVIASAEANGIKVKDLAIATVIVARPAYALLQQVRTIVANLGIGSNGNDVKILQLFLIYQNKGSASQALAKIGATGYFGVLTRDALVEFQAQAGIKPALGNLGAITRAYLSAIYK